MGQFAMVLSLVGALVVGFLQLSGSLLLPLAALAVYGFRAYHPDPFEAWQTYAWSFVGAFVILGVAEWMALIVSLHMSSH